MSRIAGAQQITAIIYGPGDAIDPKLQELSVFLARCGARLCGFVQHNQSLAARRHCDMVLEELASGALIAITQDLGDGAHGCRLDVGELLRAMALTTAALAETPDLLIINRFGKTEAAGGGVRPLIVDAVDHGVPLLIAVPLRNVISWHAFIGDLAVEHQFADLPAEVEAMSRVLGLALPLPILVV